MCKKELTIDQIVDCRNTGKKIGLHAIKQYWRDTAINLQLECNGVGPEWMPQKIRKKITKHYKYFLPSTNIHDYEAKRLPNTDEAFNEWNKRLHDNMKIQYVHDYKVEKAGKSWLNPKRAIAKIKRYRRAKITDLFYFACQEFGKKAFEDAHND